MRSEQRLTILATVLATLAAATVLSGCSTEQKSTQNATENTSTARVAYLNVPSGTSLEVTLNTALTSETASVGDVWTGSIQNAVIVDGRDVIPAGSAVAGTVTAVKPAHKGDRAMLDLGLKSVTVGGRSYEVHGTTEAIIAGSTRARNLGAIAGSAAAGALIGKAVSGSNKGAVVGGVVGGGVATGVVSQTEGYQVVLKQGIALTFTTNEPVAVRQ